MFETNDEDYQDNMKTITHKNVDKNEGVYEDNTMRYAAHIYM